MEHFNINGSLFLAFANCVDGHSFNTDSFIYKFNDSTGKFFLYQTIATNGAMDVKYFTISDEHYLAVANFWTEHDSVIYKWNGQLFDVFQNITTSTTQKFSFFTIDKEPFLAASRGIADQCTIYKWKNNTFETFQVIRGSCSDHDAFAINNEIYFAHVDYRDHLVIYKWSGENFSQLQTFQRATISVKFFNINEYVFVALGGANSAYICKWNGSQFILFQSIPSLGRILNLHSVLVCGQTFLGLTEYSRKSSTLYRFFQGKFTRYQRLSTFDEPRDMTSFEYKGQTYLAIANLRNNTQLNTESTLYMWNL